MAGATVGESLEAAFALYPKLRGYVLDEHGALRFHMAIYVDGVPVSDRRGLSDSVPEASEIAESFARSLATIKVSRA